MRPGEEFFNLYSHDFVRVAVATPRVRVGDPATNAAETIRLMPVAAGRGAILAVFPELGLSAYSCEDLFHQRALLDGCREALGAVLAASRSCPAAVVVGLPLEVGGLVFNCAAVVHAGRLLGVVPKTYLPTYREFYERRYFASADAARATAIELCGQRDVAFGAGLVFQAASQPRLRFHVEICEDLWAPIPPSSYAALAGATVLLNLSASNVTVGKADYRRQLVANQSARCLAAYVYASAGAGESTTDLAWDGQTLIAENGGIIAEGERFARPPALIAGDLCLERLVQDRLRQTTFAQAVERHRHELTGFRTVPVPLELPQGRRLLERIYERFPYVPAEAAGRDARCREVYRIQVQGLTTRLEATGIERVVIGVSGGLDSTQAVLVAAEAMEALGRPRTNILGYTMPGFATSARTLDQARRLMAAIGCHAETIDIRPSCRQMLADIGHPAAGVRAVHDVTYENVQAGERTSHLFRLANLHDALVVGTSDLSELALGWCTYGVGDQMSHYAVNASVPKTLVQHVVGWVADTGRFGAGTSDVLRDILATRISPELVPAADGGEPAQSTEEVLGPFALHDFALYYTLRFGFAPSLTAFLAWSAWHDAGRGPWPAIPMASRRTYAIGEIKRWLGVFLGRFLETSQFKRSTIPNAPKVGSGGALSPRADWRAPSDGSAAAWLRELALLPDGE
ncbi:MAG: NAD(+) synthase [Candidatus Rokubacteria bacterium]|nr:NAD(+) synthase [Candidatus Rokubacteria bacterium]